MKWKKLEDPVIEKEELYDIGDLAENLLKWKNQLKRFSSKKEYGKKEKKKESGTSRAQNGFGWKIWFCEPIEKQFGRKQGSECNFEE